MLFSGNKAIDNIVLKNCSLPEQQIRKNERLIAKLTDSLFFQENANKQLEALKKFSSGDCDCSYDEVRQFLDDYELLSLLSDQNGNRSNVIKLDALLTPELKVSGETSFSRNQDNSACFCTRHLFVFPNIQKLKLNEQKWLRIVPTTGPSVFQIGLAVNQKPGIEKHLQILIKKTVSCDKKPLQIMMEIMNQSSTPQSVLRQKVDLFDDSDQSMCVLYKTLMNRSKQNSFLDKKGNLMVQCIVNTRIPEKTNENCTLITYEFILLALAYILLRVIFF